MRLGKGVQVSAHIPASVSVRLTTTQPTAQAVLDGLEASLPRTAKRIFTCLFEVALATLQAKAQALSVSQQVIHQPVEIICAALGISRVTFYTHLATLEQLGLVHHKAHKASWYGLTRSTGTLFAVSLKAGHKARLRWFDLKHQWRDLQADTQREGRTAWSFLKVQQKTLQSLPEQQEACRTALKAWAVNPGTTQKPVTNDCKEALAETVYSLEMLSTAHYSKRPALVDNFAQALARGFIDGHNLNFWRKLIWDALRRDAEGLGSLYRLTNALTRLMVDVQEWKGLKAPGALLVHRLKECGLWDELRYS